MSRELGLLDRAARRGLPVSLGSASAQLRGMNGLNAYEAIPELGAHQGVEAGRAAVAVAELDADDLARDERVMRLGERGRLGA